MEMLPMGDLPDDLQRKIEEYNRNFESIDKLLGEKSLMENGAVTDLRIEATKEVLAHGLPIAVRTLIGLCAYAKTETVQLKAALELIRLNMGKEVAVAEEDEATKLIKRLQRKEVTD